MNNDEPTLDLVAAWQQTADAYREQYRNPPPVVAVITRWRERLLMESIAVADGVAVDDVDHERLRREFQRYGFDDYEVIQG